MNSFFHYAKVHEEYFMEHGQPISYKKGQTLIRPEDENHWIYFLRSGLVEVSFTYNTGEERLVGHFVPGHTFAQSGSFYMDEGGGLEYTATTPVEVLRITSTEFFALIKNDTDFSHDYIQTLLKNQLYLIDRIVYQGESSVVRKTTRWLLFMSKYYCETGGGEVCKISVPLTQNTVAKFLHITRESASKALKLLVQEGLISIKNKHITILNIPSLINKLDEL